MVFSRRAHLGLGRCQAGQMGPWGWHAPRRPRAHHNWAFFSVVPAPGTSPTQRLQATSATPGALQLPLPESSKPAKSTQKISLFLLHREYAMVEIGCSAIRNHPTFHVATPMIALVENLALTAIPQKSTVLTPTPVASTHVRVALTS